MADRAKRRKRERMILAASVRPFEIHAAAFATIEAGKAEDTGPAPVTVEAYGGGLMNVNNIGPMVVDIEGIEASGPVVLLDGHTNTLAASLGSARLEPRDGKLFAVGAISRTNPVAKVAIDLARDGVPIQASIGAEPIGPPIRIRQGQTVHVNGRDIEAGPGGFLLFRRSRVRHIAILPNGADSTTTVSIAAAAASPEEYQMTFDEWLASLGFDPAALSDAQKTSLQTVYDGMQASADTGEGDEDEEPVEAGAKEGKGAEAPAKIAAAAVSEIRAEMANETKRIQAIRKVCGVKHADIEAKAISEGWDATRAELEVFRASFPRLPAIHTQENGNVNTKVIEAALCMRAGVACENGYDEQTLDKANKLRNRGFRWHAEQIMASKGISIDADPSSREWIQAAFSTSELSGIVGNIANKALQNAFGTAPTLVDKITAPKSHTNFHPHTVYSMALDGELKPVAPDGELKHLRMSEESRTRQVDTKGAILRITRKDLVNDELGAFTDMATAMGRKALHSREKALFTVINATGNGSSFFTAARGNYLDGAGSLLASAGLGSTLKLFRDQTDPSGDPVMVNPAILLLPTALEQVGRELYTSQKVVGPSTSKTPDANIYQGMFEPLVSPWLGNTNLSGASSTAYYLLADPADVAAFEIAYLNGQSTPTVTFFGLESDARTLGATWQIFYDFGVALAEYRAGVKSRGNG